MFRCSTIIWLYAFHNRCGFVCLRKKERSDQTTIKSSDDGNFDLIFLSWKRFKASRIVFSKFLNSFDWPTHDDSFLSHLLAILFSSFPFSFYWLLCILSMFYSVVCSIPFETQSYIHSSIFPTFSYFLYPVSPSSILISSNLLERVPPTSAAASWYFW